jgi:hypothetical protein
VADAQRLRLLIGLRQLDSQLDQAAELATMCAACRCDEVSDVHVDLCGRSGDDLHGGTAHHRGASDEHGLKN